MNYLLKLSNVTVKSSELNLKSFDTIISEGSNNTIFLDNQISAAPGSGNNFIYGVGIWNILQYFNSPKGIYLDATKEIIKNGYGGTDTFSGITGFQGSGFSDYFIGSNRNEIFITGPGSDTVIGGGGYDRVGVEYGSELSSNYIINFDKEKNTYTINSLINQSEKDIFIDIDEITFSDKTIYNPNSLGLAVNAKFIGFWKPIDDSEFTINYRPVLSDSYWSNFSFGEAGLEGFIGIGNSYADGFQYKLSKITPVNSLLVEQQASGDLKIVTNKYLSTSITNGAVPIVITDFNLDGKQDVLLVAENEVPFIASSSTAYISNANGGFNVIDLRDSIIGHDAVLVNFADPNHQPLIVTKTFYSNTNYYKYINGKFEFSESTNSNLIHGQSIAVADLNGDGNLEAVIGSIVISKNAPFGIDKWYIGIFPFSNTDVDSIEPLKILTPYLTAHPLFSEFSSEWGKGISDTNRIWIEDFNHDGKLDILAGTSMYKHNEEVPSMLQMFQNSGDLNFTDVSDKLFTISPSELNPIDYELQIRDIDKSGINSLLSSSKIKEDSNKNSNFILLNDGTGVLHDYVRKEYVNLLNDVEIFAKQNGYLDQTGMPGKFHPYLTKDGKISFLVEIGTTDKNNIPQNLLIQLPLNLCPTDDFTQTIKILDRNQSQNIRTWAGNDSFTDLNSNQNISKIDGGLGVDIALYSGKKDDYSIKSLDAGSFSIRLTSTNSSLPKINDALVNVERLQFTNTSVAIDLNGNAGTTAKILGAVFGKDSLYNKNYVGIGLHFLDAGWTYDNLAALALDAAGAKTNDQVVSLLWTNVIGTKPTPADKQPFIEMLENGMSAGALAHLAADTSFNSTNINLVGLAQTGIEYIPVS